MIELPRGVVDGAGVRLREPRAADADDIVIACRDPETRRYLHALPDPYTRESALWWINEATPASWRAGGANFVVVDPDTDRVNGGIGINRVVGERRQGEVGYWVAPWARGRGIARAATTALTAWAFGNGLGRMELLTEQENAASQRVALAAGYRYEGVRRGGGVGPGDSRHDLVVWTRLPADPPPPTVRPLPDLPAGELTDGVVALRPVRPTDADDLLGLYALADVIATSVPPATPTRDEILRRCARAESRWLAGERADLTIRDARHDELAGAIGLYFQEPITGQAMIGYSLLPLWRGQGYATRAVRLLADWALRTTTVNRLIAGTAPANLGSRRVLERAGFQREGTMRGRLPTAAGGRADDLLYGLLASDLAGPPATGPGASTTRAATPAAPATDLAGDVTRRG